MVKKQQLPADIEDDPAVAAAAVALARVREQRREIEGRVLMLQRAMDDATGDGATATAAAKLLAGAAIAEVRPDCSALAAEIESVKQDYRIAEAAEQLAQQAYDRAREAAIEQLVPLVKAEYSDVCKRIAAALIELKKLTLEEIGLRDKYLLYNVKLFPGRIRPFVLKFDAEYVAALLNDGREYGLLTRDQVEQFEQLGTA